MARTGFSVKGITRWTLDKLLKGAGRGAAPTEIDVPGGVTFTELVGGEDYQAQGDDGVWEDWDLSAIIGAGATAVLLAITNQQDISVRTAGARKNGTALERKDVLDGTPGAPYWQFSIITQCDANRVIDIYAQLKADIYFQVLGYWS